MPLAVQYACFHPGRAIAYVACSNGGVASPGDRHCLAQVALDAAGMTMSAEPVALPYRPLHAAMAADRNRLALAYNRPAAVTVHDLDSHGFVQGRGRLAEGEDLVGHFPHQVIPMPACEDWLLTCRGDDAGASGKENPGSLRVLRYDGDAMACAQAVAPNGGFGFGPRNCAFHPHKEVLYAVLERQNRLAGFRHRNGVIDAEPCWNVGLLRHPDTVRRPQLGGAIAIHPAGRFAFVVNRAHPAPDGSGAAAPCGENSIVVFRLDDATGEPRELQRVALNGLHARCLALSPDGAILVAALRQAGRRLDDDGGVVDCAAGFASFHVADSGHLTFMHQDAVDVGGEQLFWADFVPVWDSVR
ncbi:beta-propeller fold lactonase family protein [Achromobacter aloeverae]